MPSRVPTVLPRISRNIEDIRAQLFGFVDQAQDALAAKGLLPARLNLNKGVVRGLIEIFAWGQWQLYTLMERLLTQAAPYFSSGAWLNVHADSVGLTRREATKAQGKVRFYRTSSASDGNMSIPAGRIVKTRPDGRGEVFRYATLTPALLATGAEFVEVLVEAESYGVASNVSAGQICELVTPVTGIGAVSNAMDWLTSEGANEETDSQLAERYRLQWMANNGCTKYAYQAWALSVSGVTSVSVLDRHPRGQGTVDVVVRGADVLPTAALLDKVRAAIAPHTPINDDWMVKAPIPVPVRIDGIIEYVSGDPEQIKSQTEQKLRALYAESSPLADVTALQIGQDVTPDLLTHTVLAVPGVKSVLWESPTAKVVVPAAGVARLESLTLRTVAAEEM